MRRHPERLAVVPGHIQRASFQRQHLAVKPEVVYGGHHALALLVAQLDLAGGGLQVAVEAQRRVVGRLQIHQPVESLACPPLAGACRSQIPGLVQMAQDGFQVGRREQPGEEFGQRLQAHRTGGTLEQQAEESAALPPKGERARASGRVRVRR